MDCIYISDIHCYGYIGYFPEEQVLGQWFVIDVTLWLDLSQAGKSDALEDTLNYSQATAAIEHLVKTSKFALIERLAEAIAVMLLELPVGTNQNLAIQQVRVRVTKPSAPIPDFKGKIAVEITRTRTDVNASLA